MGVAVLITFQIAFGEFCPRSGHLGTTRAPGVQQLTPQIASRRSRCTIIQTGPCIEGATLAPTPTVMNTSPRRAFPLRVTDVPMSAKPSHIWRTLRIMQRADTSYAAILNYGAFKDTQLTWSFPLTPNPGPSGIGVVWEPLGGGVKYRFIEEDDNGWRPQVAFFPQVFIPVGPANRGTPVTECFPIWLQKSLGPWTMFGGGGYTNNPGPCNKNFANTASRYSDRS